MADSDNPGQFGNRENTEEQAKKGGEASSSQQDMSELGKKGAAAQPTEAKQKGGENSHKNS
ncbi:MAG TPA: hypothetical protein VMY99_04900 [Nevskiaceae bacterium]|nr:hypothetical protein [Nevskiaceae bacterium]